MDVPETLRSALADRYAIERELGRGGFATVFLATDLKHQRQVALKVLHPELALALGSQRFLREIAMVAQFRHPHILPLYDSGEADGLLYYVMPFIEGESLRQRLDRQKQLPLEDALRITREVADALGYAHQLGVVHRDVKPENILFEAGHAIVADFGIARAVSSAGGAKLTETGLAVGTPAYMSPEQAAGDPSLDVRSDIYSLACVLYEMLGGAPPFAGPTPQAVLAAQIADPVPSLRALRPAVPPGVERALDQALAKEPAERYATAGEFVERLTRASTAEAVAAEARRERARRRRRAVLALAGIVVVASGGWWAVKAIQTATGHATIKRLAVLPLASFTNDTTQDYFVQGVHEALISNLQEAGLTVLGRTSVLRYRRTEEPPRQIARELGVDALIEGSVMRSGDSVEISVRLIDGRTELARWEHTYPGELRSVFALYHGVTRAIAEQVHSALSPEAAAKLAGARTVDPQAYDDCLKGDFLLLRFTPDAFDAALEFYRRALRRDSTYAPAWAGVAQVWLQRGVAWLVPPREAFPQARVALQRALELDSNSTQVQSVTGSFRWEAEWDWAGAERAYRRAIAINPNNGDARSFYSAFLGSQGRLAEARAQAERSIELDPLNPWPHSALGSVLAWERRWADALRAYQKALQITPDYPLAVLNIAEPLHYLGRFDEELAMDRRQYAGDQGAQAALTKGLAEGGYRSAMRHLAVYISAHRLYLGVPFVVAQAYVLAGEKDSALAWLERGYQARDASMITLDAEPEFDSLRDDPRFRDLCRRMNLPRCAQGRATAPTAARPGT